MYISLMQYFKVKDRRKRLKNLSESLSFPQKSTHTVPEMKNQLKDTFKIDQFLRFSDVSPDKFNQKSALKPTIMLRKKRDDDADQNLSGASVISAPTPTQLNDFLTRDSYLDLSDKRPPTLWESFKNMFLSKV